MICPNCKSRNPIGNKFCRECGAPLVLPAGSLAAEEAARVEAERTAEKSAALLTESHSLADAKKFDEAILRAEEAAILLPRSTSAHSLLATLYERTEQNEKAIAAMEKVVAMNPESAADQIKLDQLRRGVHMLPRDSSSVSQTRLTENAPLPWVPLALAGGAVVVVLGAGLFWLSRGGAGRTTPPTQVSRPVLPATPAPNAANPNGAAPQYVAPTPLYGGTTVPAPPPPANQTRPDPFTSLRPSASPSAAPTVRRNTAPVSAAPSRPVAPVTVAPPPGVDAPNAGNGGANALPPIPAGPPAQTGGDGGSGTTGNSPFPPSAPGFGTGGRIPAGPPPQAQPPSGGGNAPTAPSGGSSGPNSNSYIHISVGSSSNRSGGGGSRVIGGETQSPLARARALQQAGQYNEAIGAYRTAIAGGASAGSAYQSIAQCYESLGDPGGARNAYRDAIRAYSAQAAGKGSGVSAALRGIASCKAALEVLGGG